MAMDLNAKAAYIRGMMKGMEFDPTTQEGKIIVAMMDLLEEMAAQVVEHDNALDQVYDELETLDQDVDDIVSDLYADDDEDDDAGRRANPAPDHAGCSGSRFRLCRFQRGGLAGRPRADGYRRFDRRRRYGYQPQHRQ